jgi:hypothetical protein
MRRDRHTTEIRAKQIIRDLLTKGGEYEFEGAGEGREPANDSKVLYNALWRVLMVLRQSGDYEDSHWIRIARIGKMVYCRIISKEERT